MEALIQFMIERGISETTVAQFSAENIDPASILIMPDGTFETFLPKMGDRIAVLDFCRRLLVPKKQSLIERLKLKIEEKNSKNTTSTKPAKQFIKKKTRLIEIGWVCSLDGDSYTHVRKLQGGGTRQIQIDRAAKVEQVKQKAVDLFFTNGVSTKGPLSDFDIKLVDFQLNELDQDLTIDEYFSLTALTKLRFYLASKRSTVAKQQKNENAGSFVKRRRTEINYYIPSDDEDDGRETSKEPIVDPSREYLFSLISNEGAPCEINTNHEQEPPTPGTPNIPTTTSNNDFAILVNSILDEYETGNVENGYPTDSKDFTNSDNSISINETPTSLTLSDILESLRNNINPEKISHFNVFREDVFGCCVRAMRRKTFSPFNKVSVKFSDTEGVSEGAVDVGGPSREMFRLALNYIMESRMFCGGKKKNICRFVLELLKKNSILKQGD